MQQSLKSSNVYIQKMNGDSCLSCRSRYTLFHLYFPRCILRLCVLYLCQYPFVYWVVFFVCILCKLNELKINWKKKKQMQTYLILRFFIRESTNVSLSLMS